MANIPQNTNYQGDISTILTGSSNDLLKRVSEIIARTSNAQTPATNTRGFQLTPPTIGRSTDITAAVGQPFASAEPGSKTPVTQYNQEASQYGRPELEFAQPSVVVPRLAAPTDRTQIVTAPSSFEDGGQYLLEEGAPGTYLKNTRTAITPEMKRVMLNGLSSKNFEVDHIVPLWAGGADTLENVQVIPKAKHAKKTAIQAVPYTLFYYSQLLQRDPKTLLPDEQEALGNLDPDVKSRLLKNPYELQQARFDVMNWEAHSSTNIPDLTEYGLLDPRIASNIYESWGEVPGTGIKDWLKEIPAAANQIGGAIGKTAGEVLSAIPVVGPTALGALKGMVSGVTLGWEEKISPDLFGDFETDVFGSRKRVQKITGAPVSYGETVDKIERAGYGIGEIVGNIVGFGAPFKAVSDLMYGVAGAEGVKGMNIVSRTLNKIGIGAKTAKEVTTAVANTAKVGEEVAKVARGAGPVIEEMMPTISAGIKNGKLLVNTGIPQVARSAKVVNLLKNIGAMEVIGQMSATAGDEGRGKRAIYDALYGGLIGYQSHSMRGYSSVFTTSLWISMVEGDDAKDAFTNAAVITGMHGIGHKQGKMAEQQMKEWADTSSRRAQLGAEYVTQHKLYLLGLAPEPEGLSRYVNEGIVPETYKGMPESVKTRFETDKGKFRARVIGKINNMIDNQITLSADKKSFRAGWDEADVKKIFDEYNVALGILDKSTMPVEIRTKADREDLKQFLSSMKTEEQSRDFAPSEIIARRLNEIGQDGYINRRADVKQSVITPDESFELGADAPIGDAVATGYGNGISPLKSKNYDVAREAQADGRLAEKVIVTFNSESGPYIRELQSGYTQEQLTSGEKYIDPYPENIGTINNVMRDEKGNWTLLPRGVIASDHRLNNARMKLEEVNGNVRDWQTVEGDHLVTALNENTKFGYGEITIDKDKAASFAKRNNLRALYAEVVVDRRTTSGEPFLKISFTPENLKQSVADFAGTATMKPEPAPYRTALNAAVAKTSEEARASVNEMKKTTTVEPSDVLIEKATVEKTDGARVVQGVSDVFATSMRESKSPSDLIATLAKNSITIDEATATKWMMNPGAVTLNEAISVMKQSESPIARTLYENIVVPYFKSPEAVSTPGMKAILESPILGSKPDKGGIGYTSDIPPEELAKMKQDLDDANRAFGTEEPQRKVRVTYDVEEPFPTETEKRLKPPKISGKEPSETPKMPARAQLAPPEVKIPTKQLETPVKAEKGKNTLSTKQEPAKRPPEVVAETAAIEEQVSKTGETPLQKTEREVRNIPEEDIIDAREQSGEWSKYSNGRLEGADKLLVERRNQYEKGSKEWKSLQEARKILRPEVLKSRMRSAANKFKDASGVDVEKAFDEFSGAFSKWIQSHGNIKDPLTNSRNRADLFHLFHRTIQGKPRDLLSINLNKEGASFSTIKRAIADEPSSYMDDRIDTFNTSKGTDIQTLYVEQPRDRKVNQEHIMDEFLKNGYVPMGVTGNTRHSYFGVKFDKKLAEMYDTSPERYASKLDKGTLTSDYDKFVRVFSTDVLGLSPNSTSGDILKRWKIMNSHQVINAHRENGKVPTYRFIVAKSPTFKDRKLLDRAIGKDGPLSKEKGGRFFGENEAGFQQAVEDINSGRSLFDGAIFTTMETGKKIVKANGMRGAQTDAKPTTIAELSGGIVQQKGNLFFLSKAEQAAFEEMFNVKLEDNSFLTFDDNIKIGKELLQNGESGMPEFELPATGMRIEYHNPHQEASTFSTSIESKFSVDDNVNGELKKLFKPHIDQWKSFVKEMNKTKTPEEIRSLFEKYPEYKISEESFQQKLVNAMNNGAGKRSMMRQLQTQALSALQKHVLAGEFITGDHLKIRPDMGIIKDPKTGESRFLESNEIALSEKKWEAMGKPEEVMYVRFPVTRKTAIVRAKVVPTSEIALGGNQAVVSHYDGTIRLEADYDGDAITLFKIGGKDGVPKRLAESVEAERSSKGDIILPSLSKFEKRPITMESLNEDASSALLGGEEIGKAAAAMRVMNDLVGANINVRVEPTKSGERRLTVFSGEKPIWVKKIKGKDAMDLKADWGDAQHFQAAKLSQEAVDSLKSPDLAKTLESRGMKDASGFLFSELFKTTDKDVLNAIQSFQWKLQTPFTTSNRGKPIEDFITFGEKFNEYDAFKTEIENAGGSVGPAGEIFSSLKGFEVAVPESEHILYKADVQGGVANVKNYAKNVTVQGEKREIPLATKLESTIKQDPLVKRFTDFVNQKRLDATTAVEKMKSARTILHAKNASPEATERAHAYVENAKALSDHRKEVIDYYDQIASELSPEQRDAIHYWLLTREEANIRNGVLNATERQKATEIAKQDPDFLELLKISGNSEFTVPDYSNRRRAQGAGDVWRFDEIFNETPNELAKAYYEGFETWTPSNEQQVKILRNMRDQITKTIERKEDAELSKTEQATLDRIKKTLSSTEGKTPEEDIDTLTRLRKALGKIKK